jgi:predicted TIM-barrel fold metal-dependent hydrolase
VLITEMVTWAQRTVPHLILAGVFERYPRLRFVPTEQGVAFVRSQLQILDSMVPTLKSSAHNRTYGMFGGSSVDELTMAPSEYVRRNVIFAASAFSPYESDMIAYLGEDHLMWGSDYPHEEGTTPDSRLALRWTFHDVAEKTTRKILAGNAGRVYGFDLEALVPVAQRVGPRVEEVHTPLGDTGYTAPAAFWFRPYEGGLALKRLAPERQPVG